MSEITCPFCDYTGRKDHVQRHGKVKHPRDSMTPLQHVSPTLAVFRTGEDCWGFCWICYNKLPGTLSTQESAVAACKRHRCRAAVVLTDISGAQMTVVPTDAAAATTPAAVGLQSLLTDPVLSPRLTLAPGDTRTLLQVIRDMLHDSIRWERTARRYAAENVDLQRQLENTTESISQPLESTLAQARREILLLQSSLQAREKRIAELERDNTAYQHNTAILQRKLQEAQANVIHHEPAVNGFKC